MEDFVTWVDSSKIKKNIMKYRDAMDDFDLCKGLMLQALKRNLAGPGVNEQCASLDSRILRGDFLEGCLGDSPQFSHECK